MIRISKTFTRPNTNTAWWFQTADGAEFSAYRLATYGNKLSDSTNEMSQDGLTWRYSVNWPSAADRDVAHADPVFTAATQKRASYNAAHGITETETEINVI